MKNTLLSSTALIGAAILVGGAANAAEAPTWKLSGNMNFQFYWIDQDNSVVSEAAGIGQLDLANTKLWLENLYLWNTTATGVQDHDWYFGVDEAELQLNVSGTADNGLNYGFKVEIQTNTDDTKVADEVRLQLSGGWGTLQMGDEDGAEDIMNYGGENLMGATGGFDGDQDDYLIRARGIVDGDGFFAWETDGGNVPDFTLTFPTDLGAPSYPTIAGDTGDSTKISYFSPRVSGFQAGFSLTPTPNNGDDFKADGDWENHYGIGANYDNSFGDLRIRASAVYSAASSNQTDFEDVSAFQVGGIIGWGPFSLGAGYGDNGDSGRKKIWDIGNSVYTGGGTETSFWNVAAGFETGPLYLAAGYFAGTTEFNAPLVDDSEYTHIALTADYTVAPGLGVYAEVNLISDEIFGGSSPENVVENSNSTTTLSNDTTSFILGVNASF